MGQKSWASNGSTIQRPQILEGNGNRENEINFYLKIKKKGNIENEINSRVLTEFPSFSVS